MKAKNLIEAADVIVYDRLVSSAILAMIPRGIPCIDVGKQPNRHPVPQQEINEILVRLGGHHRRIVRLKGGDPFIFGRGGEEAEALAARGIPFEIVPGVTSAQGCAASLALPLTHRGCATGVRFLTGHCRQDAELDFDWKGLADPFTTLVIYMGLANIGKISRQLITHGRAPTTPVAAINNGTLGNERNFVSILQDIPRLVEREKLKGPTLFIIGEVVNVGLALGKLGNVASCEKLAAV